MAQKKTDYLLYTPGCVQSRTPLVYKYDRVDGIELTVRKTGFCVKMQRGINKTPETVLQDRVFLDAVKKAEFVQLLEYGRCSEITELCIDINGQSFTVYDAAQQENLPLVYSMCGHTLKRPLVGVWSSGEILQTVIGTPKSRYDRKFAALFALLMAHSKEYETERFMYLWMALNGLYGYVAEIANKYGAECGKKKWITAEYQELKLMSVLMKYPYRGMGKDSEDNRKDKLRHDLEHVCAKVREDEIAAFAEACLSNNESNPYVAEVKTILAKFDLQEVMHPYSLMLLWLPYQVRCKYFHAENSVPLLCYRDEHPLPTLKIINRILEEFLDAGLPAWFSETSRDRLVAEIEHLAENCGFSFKNLV